MYKSKKQSEQFFQFLQAYMSQNVLLGDARIKSGISFIGYLQRKIDVYRNAARSSAATKLNVTLKVFCDFLKRSNLLKDGELFFEDITGELLVLFEKDMKSRYLSPNTTSFYMRILRSHYHQGIDEGLYFSFSDPFRTVFTGVCRTRKRALTSEELVKINQIELPRRLCFARDIFMFSFYARGMSFVDIAYLKRENIVKGEIRYCRRKTGQLIRIRIEPCIQNIIDKYSNDMSSDYVFPILEKRLKSVKYNTSLKNLNNSLLKISELLSLDPPVTTYVARHTWATMARRGGVPVSTISECMGHTSEKTTQIYLSSIEQKSIDDANRLVIHSLNQR